MFEKEGNIAGTFSPLGDLRSVRSYTPPTQPLYTPYTPPTYTLHTPYTPYILAARKSQRSLCYAVRMSRIFVFTGARETLFQPIEQVGEEEVQRGPERRRRKHCIDVIVSEYFF